MDISFIKSIFQNPKTKQSVMISTLFILAIIGFTFLYFNYFRTTPEIPPVEGPGVIDGKPITSSEASKEIIAKIENDIKSLQMELENDFYAKLREYKPAVGEATQSGRQNPFTP